MDWRLALSACTKLPLHDSRGDELRFGNNTGEWPWNSQNSLSFNAGWFEKTVTAVTALGHDPKTTMAQKLDELKEVLECTDCTSFLSGRWMMDWRAAV